MKKILLILTVFAFVSTKMHAQKEGKKIDDLTFLFVDEKYEDVIHKAEGLMQSDAYKKHPLIYIYASMSYYEMSRKPGKFSVGDRDAKYPKPLKMAQKHLYKFIKTDKKAPKYYDNSWIDDFKEYYIQIADTSNKLAQMFALNDKYRKSASLYKAAFKAVPSDPVLQLWQGIGEMKSKNSVEGKKSLAAAMKVIDEDFIPSKATSPVLAHGMLLAEEILRTSGDLANADKAKKLIEVFKKYDPDELDRKKMEERKAAAKKAVNEDKVMRQFFSDENDDDNKNRKGKVIIDGTSTNNSEEGSNSDDDELDKLEKEADGGK